MDERAFERELRTRFNRASIEVRRDPEWAATHGFHWDALVCWDRDRIDEEPYAFFVCQRRGLPVDPCEAMFPHMHQQMLAAKAPSRGTYLQDVEFRERDRILAEDRDLAEGFDRAWNEENDVPGRLQSIHGLSQKWSIPQLEAAT